MNQLSWLLYAADVANNLLTVTTILMVIGISCCILMLFPGLPMVLDDPREGDFKVWVKWFQRAVSVTLVVALLSVFVPSKDTVYGIAASEMGEKFSKTQTFNKAEAALNAWLDRQISPKQEEKK